MANIEDGVIPDPPVRFPSGSTARQPRRAPALVYFHGGGMVMGSNHSFEPLARTLAAQSKATVVSVDYRLAPEFPAPAQFDDAYAATEWVAGHAAQMALMSHDRRSSATAQAARWLPRWPSRPGIAAVPPSVSGAALPGPRPRYVGGVDGRTPRCPDAQPRRHPLHARARRRRQRRAARPVPGAGPCDGPVQTAARHSRYRRM